ncbi:MAG TPA: hypothetical protein DEF05_03635 [Erwinia sp.]|nr:hypothetical protein [Erwinia sp.]
MLQRQRTRQSMEDFRPGDMVSFRTEDGQTVTGNGGSDWPRGLLMDLSRFRKITKMVGRKILAASRLQPLHGLKQNMPI